MKLSSRYNPRRLFSARSRTIAIVVGLALAALSVYYTWSVSADMKHEDEIAIEQLRAAERNAVAMWKDIVREASFSITNHGEERLLRELAEHTNVPFVVTNEYGTVMLSNLPKEVEQNPRRVLQEMSKMSNRDSVRVEPKRFDNREKTYFISYATTDYSSLVSSAHSDALALFPYVQLVIIIVFAIFAYIAFSSTKQNEQNRVWVGLAKETAHQLGTPTSSLLGWVEYLRSQPVDQMAVDEMSKDLAHLMKIVDRFSKIGGEAQLTNANVNEVVGDTVMYFRRRVPRNVTINYSGLAMAPVTAPMNVALFEWVVENLLKNSLDALQGKGSIDVTIGETQSGVYVEVSDTGKGIAKGNWERIFEPGYTTKTRGWGLGLSLSRRIMQDYHKGKIAVVRSEIGRGTTFRVTLKRAADE